MLEDALLRTSTPSPPLDKPIYYFKHCCTCRISLWMIWTPICHFHNDGKAVRTECFHCVADPIDRWGLSIGKLGEEHETSWDILFRVYPLWSVKLPPLIRLLMAMLRVIAWSQPDWESNTWWDYLHRGGQVVISGFAVSYEAAWNWGGMCWRCSLWHVRRSLRSPGVRRLIHQGNCDWCLRTQK